MKPVGNMKPIYQEETWNHMVPIYQEKHGTMVPIYVENAWNHVSYTSVGNMEPWNLFIRSKHGTMDSKYQEETCNHGFDVLGRTWKNGSCLSERKYGIKVLIY